MLITVGPTREYLDPIRYLTNGSSGAMGAALASAARRLGAKVTVISGPLPAGTKFPPGVEVLPVVSGLDMLKRALSRFGSTALFIGAAAVGDWRFRRTAVEKIKKTGRGLTLALVPNPDIIAELSRRRPPAGSKRKRPAVVGFALETTRWLDNARQKLKRKGLDMIVANKAVSIGSLKTRIAILARDEEKIFPMMTKARASREILKAAERFLPPAPRYSR